MERIIKPERPAGFIDYNTEYFLARESMVNKISKVFRSFGYNPIETPLAEFLKTLVGTDETSKNIFSLRSLNSSSGDDDIALRFDHTVPFARFLAANPYNKENQSGIKLPWRRSVYGPVFRGDTPQKGRFRQFYQFDIDVAGSSSMLADAEIVAVIYNTLKELSISNFVIKVNNRKILNGFIDLLNIKKRGEISANEIAMEIMRILDKIQKNSWDIVKQELAQKPVNKFDVSPGLIKEDIVKIERFLRLQGSNDEKITQCFSLFSGIKIAEDGLTELRKMLEFLSCQTVDLDYVKIDFSVARGLDYYTGPVFETFINSALEFGSIFSGGRYDELFSRFTGKKLPAVGASIGVDRFFSVLNHLNLLNLKQKKVADVIILRLSDDDKFIQDYLFFADSLRKLGVNAEISLLENKDFSAQFNFAISQSYNYALIFGEREREKNVVVIKDLIKREQKELKFSEFNNFFKS
ncbi:MAG: histidine--tRNA ligase [Candidatus Pacebacteria bacterium]|nr:histidine--tRNA ligase [Candidatus Paceibacterota bacterium]